ncbi:hypothetical protein PROFUN_03046 [Planoprotostelium fungivorum]|uniref:Uncharacterized protein n=1 Tax=Planoprotostelium fungivorum TaxID=1890364 RepID=A0A2P6NQ34_9EUKA|nr:hypothetical protein PROFUN_03046 [Planoprotostelium fungivorum]
MIRPGFTLLHNKRTRLPPTVLERNRMTGHKLLQAVSSRSRTPHNPLCRSSLQQNILVRFQDKEGLIMLVTTRYRTIPVLEEDLPIYGRTMEQFPISGVIGPKTVGHVSNHETSYSGEQARDCTRPNIDRLSASDKGIAEHKAVILQIEEMRQVHLPHGNKDLSISVPVTCICITAT